MVSFFRALIHGIFPYAYKIQKITFAGAPVEIAISGYEIEAVLIFC
jgi:hypothetical protein